MSDLLDSNKVHANILRGTIALTKAQAIHIAGLPSDVEEQLKKCAHEGVERAKHEHDWREVTPMSSQCWCAECGGISFDDGKTVRMPALSSPIGDSERDKNEN